jgi:hypothetical protein
LTGAWSSDENILVKGKRLKVHRIKEEQQLDLFHLTPPTNEGSAKNVSVLM